MLRPVETLDLKRLVRTFTLRTSEGFVENFGPPLLARIGKEAPGVRLRFVQKPDKDSAPLREGAIDLETGVVDATTAPELRAQPLFRDRYVGVVRKRHPLAKGKVTAAAYAAGRHIVVSRRGHDRGPIDDALAALRLERQVVTIVGGFATAIALARGTDLIASVPERHTGNLRAGMHSFRLPVSIPEITVSLLWHPRLDADPAHRWLRQCVAGWRRVTRVSPFPGQAARGSSGFGAGVPRPAAGASRPAGGPTSAPRNGGHRIAINCGRRIRRPRPAMRVSRTWS